MKFGLTRQTNAENINTEISDLKQAIEKWTSKISKLNEMEAAARRQFEALEAERRDHVLAAFTDGDETSKAELLRLQNACDRAKQDVADVGVALAQAEAKLNQLKMKLSERQRIADMHSLRDLVEGMPQLARRFQSKFDELLALYREMDGKHSTIQTNLLRLHLRGRDITTVNKILSDAALGHVRQQLSVAAEMDIAAIYYRPGTDFVGVEEEQCQSILARIDRATHDQSSDGEAPAVRSVA